MVDRAFGFVATVRCKTALQLGRHERAGHHRSMPASQADIGITRPYQGDEFCRGGEPTTDRVQDHEVRLIGVRR
jgi:hypothetical protein